MTQPPLIWLSLKSIFSTGAIEIIAHAHEDWKKLYLGERTEEGLWIPDHGENKPTYDESKGRFVPSDGEGAGAGGNP